MKIKTRADKLRKTLNSLYPEVKPALHYSNAFELLVATILSAQCTDERVNQVTDPLFQELNTPRDFAEASLEEIEARFRPTGFFRNKAKSIQGMARQLMQQHGGNVPHRLEDLVNLPGVGRKTANVVLGAAFGIPGIVVDTHVKRVSLRMELTRQKDPEKIERELMEIIPRREWSDFSLRMIFFGRQTCQARKPRCPECPVRSICPYPHKTHSEPTTSSGIKS
jgi:endonuclease-3